mmetsp:Transcript_37106/g.73867  ORF Transcript_37106/g.73867 Transcript_37106/m.73867 type:complete len:327 (-) Transcript_37106:1174-2154(-)
MLQLDRVPFVDRPLHLHDHLLLPPLELVQPQLHAVDLLFHGGRIGLPHVGIQRLLHLLLQGDLALPQQHLSLRLEDLLRHVALFLADILDGALRLQAFRLDLLELLHEVLLHHLVEVLELGGFGVVLHDCAVHAVHVESKVLHGVVQILDLFFLRLELGLDAELLLFEHHLPVLLVVQARLQPVRLRRHGQQLGLLLDPVLLHVAALFLHVRDGLLHVLDLGLLGAGHVRVARLGLQLRPLLVVLAVQAIHVELFLFDLVVPLPQLLLVLLDEPLALGKVLAQLLEPVLEHLVVALGVEAVHCDAGNFVMQVLGLDFFLPHLFMQL